MRIGIDASCIPHNIAGAGRYVCGLIHGLAQSDTLNEYIIFLKQRDMTLFPNLGQNFHLVGLPNFTRPARLAWEITQPRKLAQRYRLDVWHGPHYILPKGLHKVYTVVTFHDLTFFKYPEFYNPIRRVFFRRMIRHALKRADKIVAVSQTTAEDIDKHFGDLQNKVTYVYSGTNGVFKPQQDRADLEAIKYKFKTGERFILFVGTLDRRKNLPGLLDAFKLLENSAFSDLRLVIAGQKENDYTRIQKKIISLNLTDRVILTDYCPEACLPALYAAASLFVYPSYYEGFGFPVLEAMACGTPVLTSNVSATKEISGWDEILLQPDDPIAWRNKIVQVLSDTELQARMTNYGLERVKKYTWIKTARDMTAIYANAASKSTISHHSPAYRVTGTERDSIDHAIKHPVYFSEMSPVARAIIYTLAYYDLFDYPLKTHEVYTGLMAVSTGKIDFEAALRDPALKKYTESSHGFHFLKGKQDTVALRKSRTKTSYRLLKKNRHILKIVCHFPFVRGVALSGATAFMSCTVDDDIDLFLIVDAKRLWSVYFLLALLLKLLNKRKVICLNYLFGKEQLTLKQKGFFFAHQIANLRPLYGTDVCVKFIQENRWVRDFLPQSDITTTEIPIKQLALGTSRLMPIFKAGLEKVFRLPAFDTIEDSIFRIYGSHIRRITEGLNGSVLVEKDEIKLFTNDHRNTILRRFQNRLYELARKPSGIVTNEKVADR